MAKRKAEEDGPSEVDLALEKLNAEFPRPKWKRYAAKEIKAAIARLATSPGSKAALIKPECLTTVVRSLVRKRKRMLWFLRDKEVEERLRVTRRAHPEWFRETEKPTPQVWRDDDWPPVRVDIKAILAWRKNNGWNY